MTVEPPEQSVPTPNPVVRLPTEQEVAWWLRQPNGKRRLAARLEEREETIRLMVEDPLRHGYEVPWWADARRLLDTHTELAVIAGNDSTKTWFSVKYGVEQLVNQPGIDWAFMHSTQDSSKNQQQRIVWRFLPPEWRALGKVGSQISVSYTAHNGFSDDRFNLPNGSRGFFFFYKQEPGVLTGYKLRGVCADELIPLAHLEEIRTRLLGRDGKILITFTPTEGYTPTVAEYLAGATVVEFRPSKFLPGINLPNMIGAPRGMMPYILKCRKASAAVICPFTEWNPFRKEGELEKLVDGKTTSYVKARAYGWPEKQAGTAIGKFNEVHIIQRPGANCSLVPPRPWESLYPRLGKRGTNYLVADPGAAKNWFLKWYRCVPYLDREMVFVYREWPDYAQHGEWAVPGNRHDGAAGPAQRAGFGRGIVEYKRLILEAEGWVWNEEKGVWDGTKAEPIYRRFIDPRMGGAPVPSAEEGSTIIEQFALENRDITSRGIGPAMVFEPAPGGGRSIADQSSLMLLNDRFDYDVNQPIGPMNSPLWFVVEDCWQSIVCYRTYTGLDGEKGAWKDCIDPDWYLVKANPGFVDENTAAVAGGGAY